MALNSKNKFPADKAGTKYSEFKNTKRFSVGKTKSDNKQSAPQPSVQSASGTA